MVAISPTSKAKQLMNELNQIDKKIQESVDVLDRNNNIGMETPLVDDDGFPKSDIDVYAVRTARHDIICLRNDREKLMSEIAEALAQAHQFEGFSSSAQQPASSETVHRTSNKPFAKIDSVEGNSPAESAGVKAGDLIVQLGYLHAGNFHGFQQLKMCVQESLNKPIKLTVYRTVSHTGNHVFRLELTPKRWEGAGTVGCTFSEIKDV